MRSKQLNKTFELSAIWDSMTLINLHWYLLLLFDEMVEVAEILPRRKQWLRLSYIVYNMAAEGPTTQGARALAVMVLSLYSGIFRFQHQQDLNYIPDSKIHGACMGPTWGRQHPGGPHVVPMNLAIRHSYYTYLRTCYHWTPLYQICILN